MSADEPASQPVPPPSDGAGIPPEQLKGAFQAFKKRLKLARLDDESRLGHRATSSGGKSSIEGIQPPRQFPREVWEELVRRGKLRYVGHGLYGLGADQAEDGRGGRA
jgi:hypothetical protein